jgi:cobalt-zinc-cadmium efflux system membrane fusion protein
MKHFVLLCICATFLSCHNNDKQVAVKINQQTGDSILNLENPDLIRKIKISKVVTELYQKKIITSGIVKAIPNNYAEIASPFSGRITRSFVSLGQYVKVGSPIFEISSPAFFEAGKNYYKSNQELQLSEKNLKRQQDLFNNGVGTQKDLEEAEVNHELTKRDFENSIASLNVYHVNPEELVLGQPLIVRSPINGEVVENDIVIGQYLRDDAKPVAIVAELSNVWVIGHLKEKDINSVQLNDEVEIRLTGRPDVLIKGRVFHIGEILDEPTRSVQVYVLCKNADRIMKPGMFVTTQYSEYENDAILIPTTALYQMEEYSYVFLHKGNNKFLRRKVEINVTDSYRVLIKSGLKPDDEIVTEGGNLLMDIKNQL